jgi:chromate transporter
MVKITGASSAKHPIAPHVGLKELARGFFKIGLFGFGGVGPMSRYVIVEDRKWMSEKEYAAVLGIGQILPGGNVLNAAVIIGDLARGPAGAFTALASLLAMPLAIVIALALAYARFASLPQVATAIGGCASAAAGLVIGTSCKMAWRIRPGAVPVFFGLLAFLTVGPLLLSLIPCVLTLIPLSIAGVWLRHRHER